MRIAVLGATSQIAKDLIYLLSIQGSHELALFARRPEAVKKWMETVGLKDRYPVADFGAFGTETNIDAIINFVGSGNPAQTAEMGASIFEITQQYDEIALNYVQRHPGCRYLFLSSGASYGSVFDKPADGNTKAVIAINNLKPQDWYAVAKLYAECRHRSLSHLPIVDIRVFNYFSHTQDISARFLITDILRAIQEKATLKTSPEYLVRDFLHPSDFHKLVNALLRSPATNTVVDTYTQAPIDKPGLLTAMQEKFGLQFEITTAPAGINATGGKTYYYSLNTKASDFGYQPSLTSLEGILLESSKVLNFQTKRET